MDAEKQIKQEIREVWFKEHVATLTQQGDLQVLEWKKPGTRCYYCRFVFDGCMMYISGDIGEAVFWLTWKADVHSFNGISTSYFMEKMQAYSSDRYDYDGKEAAGYLKEWLDEHIEDMDFDTEEDKEEFLEKFNEMVDDAKYCDNEDRWSHEYVNQKYSEFIYELDSDYWEWIYHIGRVTPHRILGYIVALQMASEQLKAKEVTA
jgi:hypothetical protein